MSFPNTFLWGAATAAPQIEGACLNDGRKPSIWDELYRGHVFQENSCHVSCDHYHHLVEDIELMKAIGLQSYRFSISWSRILPDGTGKINPSGIAFYSELINRLLEANIEPMVTLYHWDLPMTLYRRGGWLNQDSSDWFEEYTRVVVDAFSDRVRYWMTLNEPQTYINLGYLKGIHAPFLQEESSLYDLTRNTLLAHGKAARTIRERAKLSPIVGMAHCGNLYEPRSETPEAIEEARAQTFDCPESPAALSWFCDPIFLRYEPESMLRTLGVSSLLSKEEMDLVSQKLDFFGINKYTCEGKEPGTTCDRNGFPGQPYTAIGWPIIDNTLYWSTRFLYQRYQLPILVSENGMANVDFVMLDHKVHDPQRIDYIHRYLNGLKRACEEGIPVLGYQYWSLLDNFEWAYGYSQRFGLIYVDFRTQKRTIKDSGYWYRSVIESNGKNLLDTLNACESLTNSNAESR